MSKAVPSVSDCERCGCQYNTPPRRFSPYCPQCREIIRVRTSLLFRQQQILERGGKLTKPAELLEGYIPVGFYVPVKGPLRIVKHTEISKAVDNGYVRVGDELENQNSSIYELVIVNGHYTLKYVRRNTEMVRL